MKSLISYFLIFISMGVYAQEKPTVIYVGDPMCSWCYGFSESFESALTQLADQVNLELVMGGLRPYNKETMRDLKDFLTGHWEHVHEASGREFNYEILDTDIYYDTEPASRAVIVARHLDASKALAYFQKVQSSFYKDNKDPMASQTYIDIAESMGYDGKAFLELYESKAYKDLIKTDFLRASSLGVRSFPTVLLAHDGKVDVVLSGYASAEKLVSSIQQQLQK